MRQAEIKRKTQETDIELAVNLDQQEPVAIETGVGFFDHMLTLFARHSRISLAVKAEGDLWVDSHHTVEDVGIVLGPVSYTHLKEIIRLHEEEAVAFKDITLLTASRTRNDIILAEFDKYNIPLVPDGGEDNYLQSVEVMVMLDTLRTINNPLNDYALTALLKSATVSYTHLMARVKIGLRETKTQPFIHPPSVLHMRLLLIVILLLKAIFLFILVQPS